MDAFRQWDVIYPSAPLFLLLNPELLRAQLRPLMEYVRTGRWRFAFAPHDLGTYPKADGRVYGGGERTEENQMPVEESGNMLLLFAALAKAEGRADFADKYWVELTAWAQYLEREGMDPANQLSSDDFAGHLAHNANLSIKAILALDGYASLADSTGRVFEGKKYHAVSREMPKRWFDLAADGDHFRLAFDKPGTWSQKYNLVWDRILNLNVFPPSIAQTESHFYRTHLNSFGLPLDNRSAYTKLDWEVWTATLAERGEDFEAIIEALEKFIQESPSRVPLTDWYWTTDAKQVGFQARSVVGGVYMALLAREQIWKKWSKRP
jgi:Glutaminase A six helical-hairpin domain